MCCSNYFPYQFWFLILNNINARIREETHIISKERNLDLSCEIKRTVKSANEKTPTLESQGASLKSILVFWLLCCFEASDLKKGKND